MSKEIAPAFQFYAAEYLADANVQIMSIEDEGCYIRLLAYCWREGSIPADPELQARLCKGTVPSSAVTDRFDFPCDDTTRLMHPRLEFYREYLENLRKHSAKGGRASAHKRKHIKALTTQQSACILLPSKTQVVGNTSASSSASASTSIATTIKTKALVCEIGKSCNGKMDYCNECFDQFWKAYPRHDQTRKEARKSWCRQFTAGMEFDHVIAWINKAVLIWDDKKYIPMPCTWINNRRWEAELPERKTGGNNGRNKGLFTEISGEPGSTSERRTERGERLYIPKQ
jgi:uncharacterized protein YdaU (DUF1376 family)